MLNPSARKVLLLFAVGVFGSCYATASDVQGVPTSTSNAPAAAARLDPTTLELYHRFTTPTDRDPRWVKRGTISVSESDEAHDDDDDDDEARVSFEPNASAWDVVAAPEELEDEDDEDNLFGGARYELSVKKVGQETASFVSIEPCRLFSATPSSLISERITLQGPHDSRRTFTGLQYATTGGVDACGLSGIERRQAKFAIDRTDGRTTRGIEIKIRKAVAIPTPVLPRQAETKPVQVDKEGKVIPPPAPKSFIQKYWIYIVPVLIVLMMGGGAEEGEQQKKQ